MPMVCRFGSTDALVPPVGQGTWNMEGDRAASIAALRRGLDLGLWHIDTAEMYGSGRVEELVGEAIEKRREEVFLVSKVLPTNASFQGAIEACERSLKRLRTDHLDVYLLHWPGSLPLEETIRAFEELVKRGKIKAWGVSNFDVADLEKAQAIAGPGKIACNQVLYNLRERAAEHAVIPWCREHDVAVVAYSPFGQGDFPYRPVLDEVAKRHGATARQVALSFLGRGGTFTIPKASSVAHVEDNAKSTLVLLPKGDVDAISREFPLGRSRVLPTA